MFDTLVESGSHTDDIARKGSFFLGTVIVYLVILVGLGVLSIYLYNANLPDASLELVTLVAPVPAAAPEVKVEPKAESKPQKDAPTVSERPEISVIAPPTMLTNKEVAKAETKEIAPTIRNVVIGERTVDAAVAVTTGPISAGVSGGTAPVAAPVVKDVDDAPPAPTPPPPAPKKNVTISGGVLNGKAISKPPPAYPAIAKAARASGAVNVQITVDESGRVVSAVPVSGHPLLQQAAASAVRGWRFTPTLLSGQPVKVTGVVIVNFTLQ